MLPDWFEKAVEMYNKDYSFLQIGRELNIDRKKVSKVLKENGFKAKYSFNTTGGVTRKFDTWRKYTFNENYFENIDTEEKAYWLGFLYADGYVNANKTSVELSLKEKDKNHLYKFIKCLNGTMSPTKTSRTIGGKEYIGYRVTLNSKKLKNDLIKLGCYENKTNILNFPYDKIDNSLYIPFIRGYIDGDGSVTTSNKGKQLRIDVIGTCNMLDGIVKSLNVKKNSYAINNKRTKNINYDILTTQWSGKYANYIAEKIYLNSNIHLDRKYEKAMQFICPPNSISTKELGVKRAKSVEAE